MSPQTNTDFELQQPLFVNTANSERLNHNYSAVSEGKPPTFRHQQFLNDLGSPIISVGNVGFHLNSKGHVVRRPLVIGCDLLQQGSFDGLMPSSGLVYDQAEALMQYLEREGFLVAAVHDAHVTDDHVNLRAITRVKITADYYAQMIVSEQQDADRYVYGKMEIPPALERSNDIAAAKSKSGSVLQQLRGQRWLRYAQEKRAMPDDGQPAQYLTLPELIAIHGESRDGEFRKFLFDFIHCVEPTGTGAKALPKWVPFMQEILKRAMSSAADQRASGITAPDMRIIPIHKNALSPSVPNGLRGTNGNLLQEIMFASQYGMPQGTAYDYQRKVLIFGMGTPYTVMYAALEALQMGYQVYLQMDATYNFTACGISMLEWVRFIRHLFPYAFHAMLGWNETLMGGPQPVSRRGMTFNDRARAIYEYKSTTDQTGLLDEWQQSAGNTLPMRFYPMGDAANLFDVVTDYTK